MCEVLIQMQPAQPLIKGGDGDEGYLACTRFSRRPTLQAEGRRQPPAQRQAWDKYKDAHCWRMDGVKSDC